MEFRVEFFVLVIVLVKISNVQPLAGKLNRQPPDARIVQHPPCLFDERPVLRERPGQRHPVQLGIRHRRPEEIAQPVGQLATRNRRDLVPRRGLFLTIEERRRGQHPCDCQTGRLFMRDLAVTQFTIQPAQALLFGISDRATPGAAGKLHHRLKVRRFGGDKPLAKSVRSVIHRAHVRGPDLDQVRAILGRKFPDLLEGDLVLQRFTGNVKQLVPQPVEMGGLPVVQHQPPEVIVLAVKQRQGDNLVNRHNAGVTQGRWEQVVESTDRAFDAIPRGAPLANQDRIVA